MRRGTNGEGCHVWCILRVFWRGFTAFSANCAIACACSFSASILSLYLFMCVFWALKLPYHSSWVFCTKKKHLEQKNRVSREDGPRFVFANVVACFLERASTRRSLALFAERGSFRNPLDFLYIQRLYGVLVLQIPIGIEWIRRRHFFPSTQRLDSSKTL
jgi:hypothetical protein